MNSAATGFPAAAETSALVNGMREGCATISSPGKAHHTLKICPPLIISVSEVDPILSQMEKRIRSL